MAKVFRILHVSDLHARASSEFDQSLLADRALEDIERLHSQRPVDLAVFGGDLAFSGKPEDFERGRARLLDPLSQRLGLGAERVIMVPGNHDVDRDRIDPVYEAGLAATLVNREAVVKVFDNPDQVRNAVGRLTSWLEFTTRYYDGVGRELLAPGAWTHILDNDGIAVGIAALNSAWRSTGAGDSERRNLLIGDRQVRDALARISQCDVRLVVVHHPLEWLTDFDARDARAELERAGVMVLTGHEHQPDPMHSISGSGSAIYARAGCLYESVDYANSYSIIDVDLDRSEVSVAVRTWQVRRRVFDEGTEAASQGVLQLPLPRPTTGGLPVVAHGDVTNALVEIVQRNSVVADLLASAHYSSVSELLVAPRFYPAPFGELRAVSRARGDGKVDKVDALRVVASTPVVIVSADPQSGVTGALAWLLEHRHATDRSRIPLFVPFSGRQGKQVIDEDLREAAARTGATIGRRDPLPPALIAVDDVVADNPRALDRLVRHVAEHPENRYILGCHGPAHIGVGRALAEIGVHPERLFLGPFGRRELKELVRKVVPGASMAFVDKILAVLGENQLPRNPFLMAALTAVLHERPDAVTSSTTVIVDRYVDLLLGRAELVGADFLDFRKRERLLEHLAGELDSRGTWRLPRGDAEMIVGEYFRKRADRKVSPGRVVDDLIDRRVLAQEDGNVAFRHQALQDLFAAKLTLDAADFAEQVMRDPVDHAALLRHRAALKLDDGALLARVGEAVREVISAASRLCGDATADVLIDLSLMDGGASQSNPTAIRARLRATAPPPPDVLDAMMDELYERLGVEPAQPVDSVEVDDRTRLFRSVDLLSGVVVSSELVDDVELRVDLLKEAIRGWAVGALAVLQREEETGAVSEIVRKTLLRDVPAEQAGESLEKIVRVAVMLNLALQVVCSLSVRQTQALLPRVLEDDAFMASSLHALLAVLLACTLRLPGWHRRLIQLRKRHGTYGFVRDLVETIALARYQSLTATDEEAAELEKFLIDIHTEGANATGVPQRQTLRGQVQGELRKGRARVQLGAAAADVLLADPDDEQRQADDRHGMGETA
jgi:predicted phosphodiesterase